MRSGERPPKREAGPVGSMVRSHDSAAYPTQPCFAMIARLIAVLAVTGVLAGCTAERTVVRPSVSLAAMLGGAFQQADDGSFPLLDRLGEPRRVEAQPIENRHVPGQVDTLRTLVFDGLEVEVYAVADGKELLQEIRVTGPGYETAEGLRVGSTRSEVREAFGAPVYSEGDAATYEVRSAPDDPTPTQLQIRYDGDRVVAMAWSYYVD